MAEQKISQSLDIYFDRTKKSIGQWIDAYSSADLRVVNGTKHVPNKKRLQDVYQYVLLDNHLSSVIEQRKSKVTGEPFAVFKNDNIDDELTKLLSKQWFSKLQDYVIDARFYGYSLIEIQELVNSETSAV